MAPSETSERPGLLEHPAEAFDHYARAGVRHLVCEEKHMGSRAVVVACRDEEAALRRFGVDDGETGICVTRTGRRFLQDPDLERRLLAEVRRAIDGAGLWDELGTDWLCLDCELMPWSFKAESLLRQQYAAVGVAAGAGLDATLELVSATSNPALDGGELAELETRLRDRRRRVGAYVEAYRRYCWPVSSLDDLALAPFHLMASEGAVHSDKEHPWHLERIARIRAAGGGLFRETRTVEVDLEDDASRSRAVDWWSELTGAGGEGMVVKPREFLARGKKGLVQPALKCRGREYLRIIYGPEYTAPENLERLRQRGLGRKRSLALRELALGLEGLQRFVDREPLRRVHECVFAVLALESEPVDPRL
jgi:protein phosphatase